jgi:signal transduction histidine kinase
VALAAFGVWPLLGVVQGRDMQVLFFGQLVPVMVLVYSLARHAPGRLRWVAGVCGVLFVTIADLFIPLLQTPNELIFHWGSITLSYLLGHALRVSSDRVAVEAVRAHEAESRSRERAQAAIAEERARIARELHDIVAHSVGVMVVQAGAAEQVVEEDPEFARRALATIRSTGSGALTEMRRLVAMLRDTEVQHDLSPQPGIAALPDLVEAARGAGLEVDLEVTGEAPSLPAGLDLTAYRIVQEALTNVRRHSEATRAQVAMDFGPGELEIRVTDAGPARVPDGEAGHGLLGMRERAALFGGEVETDRGERGFTVRAVLPLERV